MKFLILMGIVLLANFAGASEPPPEITCEPKSRGYLPYNAKTGVWIGSGYLYNKGECHEVLDTYSEVSGSPLICSWTGLGWNVFYATTGSPIILSSTYWLSRETCMWAITGANNQMVCLPRGKGSGTYDLKYKYFIGPGFYYNITDCARGTVLAKNNKVCAFHRGYTAVYNRRYNKVTSKELYMDVDQCNRLMGE